MDNLAKLGKPLMKRVSTYNPTGANQDRFLVEPGKIGKLEIAGAGCVKHC